MWCYDVHNGIVIVEWEGFCEQIFIKNADHAKDRHLKLLRAMSHYHAVLWPILQFTVTTCFRERWLISGRIDSMWFSFDVNVNCINVGMDFDP